MEGISWRDAEGEIVHEPEREKIADLDALPLPARHLLDNSLYHFPGIEGPITTVKSSRGCPLDCSFCGYTLAQGLRFRFRLRRLRLPPVAGRCPTPFAGAAFLRRFLAIRTK